MKQRSRKRGGELFWPKIVLRKWLNISTHDSDFSADESEADSQVDDEEMCGWERELHDEGRRIERRRLGMNEIVIPATRRRKSETVRAQYINTKELRICVGTWNVGGKLPPDDLDIGEWLNVEEPADIYVLGLQEIVPLNAGNIFGAEDGRPLPRWESIIRETLNRTQPVMAKVKCYSDPPSPSRFHPSDDLPAFEDEILPGSDSDSNEEEVHPLDDRSFQNMDTATTNGNENDQKQDTCFYDNSDIGLSGQPTKQECSSPKRLDRLHCFSLTDNEAILETSVIQPRINLRRTLSSSERIGLSWPEQPLNLVPRVLGNLKSFKSASSLRTYNSLKLARGKSVEIGLNFGLDLGTVMNKKKRSAFVRIISKQMVGIYLSVWVRRSLRKHIQNLKVSTVGVGVMGYIGNKGSVSVSMSIYQTLFCFVCCHLTSGEKEGDEVRRNADVREIHRRTFFNPVPSSSLPRTIYDHERIIWLGDLNYRLNLSYEKTRELITRKEWSKLVEMDQLTRELKKGHAFDGWSEGVLSFPPTYKYEPNSEDYFGEDPKLGRRNPAWCDRILSYGKGMRLLKYDRSELKLSDHRPVTAIFMAEVEVFCHRKLQRALTFTDAEVQECEIIPDVDPDIGLGRLRFGEESSDWGRESTIKSKQTDGVVLHREILPPNRRRLSSNGFANPSIS